MQKRITSMLFMCSLSLTSSQLLANSNDKLFALSPENIRTQNNLLEYAEGNLSLPTPKLSAEESALMFLKQNKHLLPNRNVADLSLLEVDKSIPNITHIIFSQNYKNIPVYRSHLVVSMKNSSNEVFRSWAKFHAIPENFNTNPSISVNKAEKIAWEYFDRLDANFEEDSELVIIQDELDESIYHLAYRVHLFDGASNAKNQNIFIDAHSGLILSFRDMVCTGSKDNTAITGSATTGQGVGVWGESRTLQTYNNGSGYELTDASRAMYNSSKGTGYIKTFSTNYSTSATISKDSDNKWNTSTQASEVDAHYFAGQVYEYYRQKFGRNSYDKNGATINSYMHYNMSNAYWSGSYMAYGEGDGGVNFYNFAGDLGVIAHELTHAVTQYGASLEYAYQSGALNEAFSDIMAKVEVDTDNWLIGDLVITQAFEDTYGVWAIRDMSDPTFGGLYDQTDPLSTMAQPDHLSLFAYLQNKSQTDNGGVHVNSGIINKMAQLLVDGGTHYGVSVTSIGRPNTAKIFYTINSASYLAKTSDFDHFATQIQAVTKDLFGSSSTELSSVVKALQAIGLLSVNCVSATEKENNGSTSSANSITTNCTDMTGYLGSSSDLDYYKLSIPAGKTLTGFLRVPYVGDYDMYVYQGSSLLGKSVNVGSGQDEQLKIKNTGSSTATIYLQVKRYSGSYGSNYKYILNASWN